ncbi:MAG: 4Fe-4S dicluster domain-containing protein [Planctomycetota bacterium]
MITLRRISQIFFLLLFIFLLIYPLSTHNLFFISNPLLALSTIVASRNFHSAFIAALAVILITVFLGRVFCGWICPLGSTMDIFLRLKKTKSHNSDFQYLRQLKYFIFLLIIVVAIFGLNIAGWFDPITVIFKSYALSIYPAMDYMLKGIINGIGLDSISNPLNDVGILDNNSVLFHNSIIFFLILVGILLITFYQSRFWCRNLCPLGALLAILSKWRFLNLNINKNLCTECNRCVSVCKTGVFNNDLSLNDEECIQCFSCVKKCHKKVVSIGFSKDTSQRISILPARRKLLIASAFSVLSVPLLQRSFLLKKGLYIPRLRPPGAARSEEEFLAKCIRCGQCMKACPTNGLQPLLAENGLYAMFSPVLVPRIGNCRYNCNICGQVCPSGAIPSMTLDDKQEWKIGTAFIDTTRCIPYADKKECITCEEFCPVPEKAIQHSEKDGIKYPYIIKEQCIGCGLCEKVCPVSGTAAIRVSPIM